MTSNCNPNSNCSYSNGHTYSALNNEATPSSAPCIVNAGDVSSQVLIPIAANVIQNCMSIKKYDVGFADGLVFTTNFTNANAPTGKVVITKINFSYDTIAASNAPVSAYLNNQNLQLSPSQTVGDNLARTFTASAITENCCCNGQPQAYCMNRIVEKNVPFTIANLNISISGCIGGTPFTAQLTGLQNNAALGTSTPLSDLGFSANGMNFVGRLSLPTAARVTLTSEFDSCLIIDNLRPASAVFEPSTQADDADKQATMQVSADLSVVVNDKITVLTPSQIAVLSNKGAGVKCQDSTDIPSCPSECCQTNQCQGQTSSVK